MFSISNNILTLTVYKCDTIDGLHVQYSVQNIDKIRLVSYKLLTYQEENIIIQFLKNFCLCELELIDFGCYISGNNKFVLNTQKNFTLKINCSYNTLAIKVNANAFINNINLTNLTVISNQAIDSIGAMPSSLKHLYMSKVSSSLINDISNKVSEGCKMQIDTFNQYLIPGPQTKIKVGNCTMVIPFKS